MKKEMSIRECCLRKIDAIFDAKVSEDANLIVKITHVNYCSIYNIIRDYLESDNVEHVLMMCTPFVKKTLFWLVAHEIGASEYAEKYDEFVERYAKWYNSDEIQKIRKDAMQKFLKEYTMQKYRTTDFPDTCVNKVHYRIFKLLEDYTDVISPIYYESLMNDIRENKKEFRWHNIIDGNSRMLMWYFLYLQGNVNNRNIFNKYEDDFFYKNSDSEENEKRENGYTKIYDGIHELVKFCYKIITSNSEKDTEYIRVCLENLKRFLW